MINLCFFELIILGIFFLIWGSFLNVVAFRIVEEVPFLKSRSFCPSCNEQIAFYDNIPVLSWFILKGRCRQCKNKISLLYPFIEILTCVLMLSLTIHIFNLGLSLQQSIFYFFSYFIFFSALIIATRTDLQAMVIPQLFSIYLVPIALLFSLFGFLKINFLSSLSGAVLGYAILWTVAKLFKLLTQKDGLGIGDMELLAMIGSFLGPIGVWICLLLASLLGVFVGGFFVLLEGKSKGTKIPFGPLLAFGSVIYFFYETWLVPFIFQ